jgi:broad specificity phosphatase PhoE
LGVTVVRRAMLRAVNFGVVSGRSTDEIKSAFPESYRQMQLYEQGLLHPRDFRIPGREPFVRFEKRILRFVESCAKKHAASETILVFAHRSYITMAVNVLAAYPRSAASLSYNRLEVPNLSISTVLFRSAGYRTTVQYVGRPVALVPKHLGGAPALQ